MAVTDAQYNGLVNRQTALETAHNDVVVAMEVFITLGQMNQLLTIQQTLIDDLTVIVTALDARVTAIENEPLT